MNDSTKSSPGAKGGQMTEEEQLLRQVRVVCTECPFSQVVDRDGGKSAKVIIEHGRETGHKLTTEDVDGE